MNDDFGYLPGEVCGRLFTNNFQVVCEGIIKQADSDTGCSCHCGNPPCSHCTDSREYCPECDWDGREEQLAHSQKMYEEYRARENKPHTERTFRELDRTKVDYFLEIIDKNKQLYIGVYPEGTTVEQVEVTLNIWQFISGKFLKFRNGEFIYIAHLTLTEGEN